MIRSIRMTLTVTSVALSGALVEKIEKNAVFIPFYCLKQEVLLSTLNSYMHISKPPGSRVIPQRIFSLTASRGRH